jgi:hypothetical protein
MRVLSISYDLKVDKSFEAYERIISAIEALGNVEKAQYSSWVISTNYTCAQVEEYLFKYVKNADSLMVLEVVSYASHNVPEAVKHLMNRTWHPIKAITPLRTIEMQNPIRKPLVGKPSLSLFPDLFRKLPL